MNDENKRECWAIQTLVSEVESLYPGVTHEFSDLSEDGSYLSVVLTEHSKPYTLGSLLMLASGDPRVDFVINGADDKEGSTLVVMVDHFFTKDTRDPFNLADAAAILGDA